MIWQAEAIVMDVMSDLEHMFSSSNMTGAAFDSFSDFSWLEIIILGALLFPLCIMGLHGFLRVIGINLECLGQTRSSELWQPFEPEKWEFHDLKHYDGSRKCQPSVHFSPFNQHSESSHFSTGSSRPILLAATGLVFDVSLSESYKKGQSCDNSPSPSREPDDTNLLGYTTAPVPALV